MAQKDYATKKSSLGTKILIGGIGLSALVGSYFTIPKFKDNISYLTKGMYRTVNSNLRHNLGFNFKEIIIPKGMTLESYGKQHGLQGGELRDWINIVKMYNLAIKVHQPDIGIDEKGNLYEGKRLLITKP